jgi:hypothetical protein
MANMDKAEIRKQLRAMVEQRLFGDGSWTTAERDVNERVHRKFCDWGLQTVDPTTGNIFPTKLGLELGVDTVSVFMGHHCPFEIPDILAEMGMLPREEADDLAERFEEGEEPENLLPPILRRLYRQRLDW